MPPDTPVDVEKLEKVAMILKTISHPIRVGVVDLLMRHNQLSVSQLCARLSIEQSLLSHHLTPMRQKGILGTDRDGKNIHYYLRLQEVRKVIDCMRECKL